MSQQPPNFDYNDPYRAANDPSRYDSDPYAGLEPSPKRPAGVIMQWILCGLMILMGVIATAMGVAFAIMDNQTFNEIVNNASQPNSPDEQLLVAIVFMAFGPLAMLLYAVAYFLPRQPWAWVVHLILQIFATLGACLVCCLVSPYAIVTLIFWCMQPTRTWYGMSNGGPTTPGGHTSYLGYSGTYPQPYTPQPPQANPPQEPWRQ